MIGPFPCSLSLSSIFAISFLLCFLKQTETILAFFFARLAFTTGLAELCPW